MIDINEIAEKCLQIAEQREANGGADGDYLKHCAGEVVEAIEAKNKNDNKIYNGYFCTGKCIPLKENYADELADIIICALDAAADDNIDIEAAILRKVAKNERRALKIGDKL